MPQVIIPHWLVDNAGKRAEPVPADSMKVDEKGRVVFIYGLVCPLINQIRYIGKSIRPEERLMNHMNDRTRCHRTNWLRSLKEKGLKPELIILEAMQGMPWEVAEKFWIKRGRELGWPLTNSTDGGDGVSGLSGESKERMAKTWVGRKHTDETKRKIGLKSRGRKASKETRKKMSNSQKGREITWGDAIAESIRKLSDEQVEEIKSRLAKGERVTDLAREFGVHRTTLSKIKMGTYFNRYRK